MLEAIQNSGMQNYQKKQLQQIGEDLKIKKKCKKQELCQEIAKILAGIISRQENNIDRMGNKIQTNEMNEIRKNSNISQIIKIFYDTIGRKQIESMRPNQMQMPMNLQHYPMNQQVYSIPQYELMQNMMGPQMPVFAPQNINCTNGITGIQQPYFPPTINQQMSTCICQYIPRLRQGIPENENNFVQCFNTNECKRKYHSSCMKITNPEHKRYFECPSCILKNMDPLHKIAETLLPPQILRQNQINNYSFFLKEDQYSQLFVKKQFHNQEIFGLELRCIRIDGKSFYETTWPDYGELEINDIRVLEFKPLQMNSSLKKRKDEKYFFREQSFLKQGWNTVCVKEIQATPEIKHNYRISDNSVHMIALYLVKKLSTDNLIEWLKINSLRSEAECKEQIMQYFKASKEEVSIDKLNVSLNCQFDFKMINTPAKSRWCKHVQCFSLENFIIVTESTIPRRWRCPICKVKCYDIIIDEYIWKIIKKCKADNINVSEVTIDQNAEYKIEKIQNDESISDDDQESMKNENLLSSNNQPINNQPKQEIQKTSTPNQAQQQQFKGTHDRVGNGNLANNATVLPKAASEIIILDEDELDQLEKQPQINEITPTQQDIQKNFFQPQQQPSLIQQQPPQVVQNKSNLTHNGVITDQQQQQQQQPQNVQLFYQPKKNNQQQLAYQQHPNGMYTQFIENPFAAQPQFYYPLNCQKISQSNEEVQPQNTNQLSKIDDQSINQNVSQQPASTINGQIGMDIESSKTNLSNQTQQQPMAAIIVENQQQLQNECSSFNNNQQNENSTPQGLIDHNLQMNQINCSEIQKKPIENQQSGICQEQIQTYQQISIPLNINNPIDNSAKVQQKQMLIQDDDTNNQIKQQVKEEPDEAKQIRQFYEKDLKDSHYIYNFDNNFDEYVKFSQDGTYEEKKVEYQSAKMKMIIQRKITKNIKKQFIDASQWIKRDQSGTNNYNILPIEYNQQFQQSQMKKNQLYSPLDRTKSKSNALNNSPGFGMEYIFQPGFNPPNFPQFQNNTNINRQMMGHFMPIHHSQQGFIQNPGVQPIIFQQNQIKPQQSIKKSSSQNNNNGVQNNSGTGSANNGQPVNQELKKKGKNCDEAICIED